MKKTVCTSLIAATLLTTLNAQEELKVSPLVTHTELGYIETSGNTKTKTFNLDANAKKAWGRHEGKILFDGQYASDNGVETKNKYLTELNYGYAFNERISFDYLAGYKSDKFSGFDYQFYTGPGLKYKAVTSQKHKLSVEANILYALDQYADKEFDVNGVEIPYPNSENTPVASLVTGAKNDYASYRLKAVYNYMFTKNTKFDQELTFRGDFQTADNYFVYSKSAISSKLSDIFSAGISYKVDYVNRPAEGKKDTDTTLTINLIMDY
jgi:putative salt-induced outer membrane protein